MDKLSKSVLEFALLDGASASGIVRAEALAGGPPSADLTYVLKDAKSAVTFAVAMDPKSIPPYLMKKDRLRLEKEMVRANVQASGIALQLSNYLVAKGHKSVPVAANLVYRPSENDGTAYDPTETVFPDIAHRYLAVQSGLGFLGMSGNLITPDFGAAVILGAVVTEAPLEPTPPLPPEANYCDDCRLCLASCAAKFMDFKSETHVKLGDAEYTYSGRRNLSRCDLVCSGYTGLSPNGRWSTWSPGRFEIPKNDEDLAAAYERITAAYAKWPTTAGGRLFFYSDDRLRVSCAHCQLICAADLEERKRRYQMLRESGVIVQGEDGSLEAMSPEEAKRRLAKMPAKKRTLYEEE